MISDVSGPPFSHQKKPLDFKILGKIHMKKMDFYGTKEQLD